MKLKLVRFSDNDESTIGLLFVDNVFQCFTLEDQHQDEKVMHETRIPGGEYEITLRTWGGFHERYSKTFADIHKGTLWIRNIPGFKYVLIHCGNHDGHTSGCVLLGDTCQQNVSNRGYIGESMKAYRRVYPPIAAALKSGEKVTIEIIDIAG